MLGALMNSLVRTAQAVRGCVSAMAPGTEVTKCRLIVDDRMRNVTVLGCLRMNVLY